MNQHGIKPAAIMLAAAVALSAALAGCSGEDQPAGESNSGKTTTITIWDSKDNMALQHAINSYTAKHKNIKIEVSGPDKANTENLPDKVKDESAPDLVRMDQVYAVSLGNMGCLADLNQLGAKDVTGGFMQSCVDSLAYDGKLYAMPFDVNTIAMLYNKDMLKKAGASVPATFDELVACNDKIKSKVGSETYAFTAPFYEAGNDNWKSFNFCFFLWGMGGEILSSDLKTAVFNSAAGVEALEKIVSLKQDKVASPTYKESAFLEGRGAAIMYNGSWQIKTITGTGKKAEFGIALLPELKKGVKAYSGLGLNCYGVTSSSKVQKEAFDFLKFYCGTKDYQTTYCTQNNMLPSLKEAQKDEFYKGEEWQIMLRQLEYAKFRPSVPDWDTIERKLSEAISTAVSGAMTAKEALDEAAGEVNRILALNEGSADSSGI